MFYNKSHCNGHFNFSTETVLHGMEMFLCNNHAILAKIIQNLCEEILYPLENSCEAELYSSSLLIFYDHDMMAQRSGCALVDFAHSKWTPGVATEMEYVRGLKNVISSFKSLCDNKPSGD